MKRFLGVLVALAILGMTAGVAQATVISAYDSDTGSFAVSLDDQPGTGATISGNGWAGSAAALNDANAAEASGNNGSFELGIGAGYGLQPGAYVTITFDLTNAPLGWDISRITSYASWSPDVGGRSRQGYSVTATLMDDSTVQVLAPQTYIDGYNKVATKVDITELGLSGVKSLTFADFVEAPPTFGSIYHEFDIFGVATVPEPSAVVLMAIGTIGLLCYAWRKRR